MVRHVKRQIKSYRYASRGVSYALKTQVNIWVQLLTVVPVILLANWLEFSLERYLILLLTIGLVLAAELLNTAVEELTNLVSPQPHPQAEVVKDVAAGAVLVTAVVAAIIGITLFVPPLMLRLGLLG